MKILISGSHGFIGSAVYTRLSEQGHDVFRLIRSAQIPHSHEIVWDPVKGYIDHTRLDGFEAVIHLAGENIYGRWTEAKKQSIRDSRVNGTGFLCGTLTEMDNKPRTLISASAVGYYGNRGEQECHDSTPAGAGFLSEVCRAWEAATDPAAKAGIRVVNLRFGMVLGKGGGSLEKMLPMFKMGMGGTLGDGQQWMSWISIRDAVEVVELALRNASLCGPVNATAPEPVRNKEFTEMLGHVLRRPEVVPVPKTLLRMVFGDFTEEALLTSIKALPTKLEQLGFEFEHPNIETALKAAI